MAADPSRARAETDAAGLLFTRHYDRVYGYCLYKLGSREEAEDAAQTAFLHAVRALHRGVVPAAEENWLITIAKNVCLERYRTRRRRLRLEVLNDPQTLAEAASASEEAGDDRRRLEDALGRIPEQQRRAFVLREWRGLSYREIAAELGVSLAAVETLIFRARRSLAELLRDRQEVVRTRGAGLGSLAAAAKSLFGGASLKLAAGSAVLSAVAVAVPSSGPVPEPPAAVPPSPVAAAAAEDPIRTLERFAPSPVRELRDAQGATSRSSAPKAKAKAKANEAPIRPPAPAAVEVPAATGVGLLEGAANTVGDVVAATGLPSVDVEPLPLPEAELEPAIADVTDAVDGVVEDVAGALPPLLP